MLGTCLAPIYRKGEEVPFVLSDSKDSVGVRYRNTPKCYFQSVTEAFVVCCFFFFLPDVPGRDIHCCDDLQLVESNHHFISVYL